MAKLIKSWTKDDWFEQFTRRFDEAKIHRSKFEPQWAINVATVSPNENAANNSVSISFDNYLEFDNHEPNIGDSEISMNYAFKYVTFLHSQMSANPPSAIVGPTSSDINDQLAADAADRLVQWGIKRFNMQEVVDQMTLNTLVYGVGWLKESWDPEKGEIKSTKEDSSGLWVEAEGDIDITAPDVTDIWADPTARKFNEVRWIIERRRFHLDEAQYMFPEQAEMLSQYAQDREERKADLLLMPNPSDGVNIPTIEIYEMTEKSLTTNGGLGRQSFHLEDGTILGTPGVNPHTDHALPYMPLTYVDSPGHIYGRSVVEYVARLQSMLSKIDSSILDSLQAHAVVRMVIHGDIEDEAISQSHWDYIKMSKPTDSVKFVNPPALPSDLWTYRAQLAQAIQDMFGINDSMLGIMKREQSAVSQQTAIEAGTMVNRRLFAKYAMTIEKLYKHYLSIIADKWEVPKIINVIGEEQAFKAEEIKGADIKNGWDLKVEYGASLPLDPNMRREAILLMWDRLIEAGFTQKQLLAKMKLDDMQGVYDVAERAGRRQHEQFLEMIKAYNDGSPTLLEAKKMEQHAARLEWCANYLESKEFHDLPEDLQDILKTHVGQREKMLAEEAVPAQPGTVPAGPAPMAPPQMGGIPLG